MGLNPRADSKIGMLKERILNNSLNGGSPYYDMYQCGFYGVDLQDCIDKCKRNGIALRKKDIRNYNNGVFNSTMSYVIGNKGSLVNVEPRIDYDNLRFKDFPMLPIGWKGTEKRFFPCTQDNKPMCQWGWKKRKDGSVFAPELYTRADARALSPCGWVGQNMLYQKFIVLDIDGRGHGADDLEVIAFGNQFRNSTFTLEDPAKPGSFHLYFETDRLLPVRHFTWAKLDFMGNAVNAAVYFKNKVGNGLPMMKFDDEVWQAVMQYQKKRKEN